MDRQYIQIYSIYVFTCEPSILGSIIFEPYPAGPIVCASVRVTIMAPEALWTRHMASHGIRLWHEKHIARFFCYLFCPLHKYDTFVSQGSRLTGQLNRFRYAQICNKFSVVKEWMSVWSLENISTYSKFQPGPMSGRTTRSPGHRKVSLGSRRGELRWWTAVTVAASHDGIQLENTEAAWSKRWYSGLWVVRPLFLKPKSWNRTERWNPGTCCWVQLSCFMMFHESVISILIVVSSVFLNLQAKEHFLERGCYMPCAGWNRIPCFSQQLPSRTLCPKVTSFKTEVFFFWRVSCPKMSPALTLVRSNPWRCWRVACWHAMFQTGHMHTQKKHAHLFFTFFTFDTYLYYLDHPWSKKTSCTVVNLVSVCPTEVRKHEKEDEGGQFCG